MRFRLALPLAFVAGPRCGGGCPAAGVAPATRSPRRSRFRSGSFGSPTGLNVILHRDASVPIVAVNVWYHVGSANERPGRTGFAHLFEHLMFEGSKNVAEGEFDTLLESAGGNNNGSTSGDRTNYVIDVPANALELALFLESDRMGVSARDDDAGASRRPARRRQERAAAELREPAVRHGVAGARRDALARGASRTAGRRSATWRT